MRRNLLKRLEIMFPILNASFKKRLIEALNTYFADNVKARQLLSDGTYAPVDRAGPRIRAQAKFHKDAVDAVQLAQQTALQFRPLKSPKE
jgi:polyphosphate kinase